MAALFWALVVSGSALTLFHSFAVGVIPLSVALGMLLRGGEVSLITGAPRRARPGEPPRFTVSVVGQNYYQSALAELCGGSTRDGHELVCEAELSPEPDNSFDSHAVAVKIRGMHVGHLSRADAKRFGPKVKRMMESGRAPVFPAVIRGGWDRGGGDRGRFDVWLNVSLAR